MNASAGRLFIIDDDLASRNAVAALAASMMIKCELFASAEEFLRRYDPSLTGCALIDWHLGGMDGLQLQQRLRALNSVLGVILVSADVEISMAIRAMKNGALGVLEKPYEADDLSDLVHEAMDHSARMRREQSEKADERDQPLLVYDLHDGVAQYLAMAITLLEQCGPLPNRQNGETGATFQDAMKLLRRAMAELRNIISGTHLAAGTENIAGMLKDVLADFHDRLEIELVHDPALTHLDTQLVRALYCIVHELLTNAWRHSQSRKVRIDVERNDGKLHIHCKDWGIGFDPANVARGRFGLQGIRGRARLLGGTTTVRSSVGEGTCVSVCLPLIPENVAGSRRRRRSRQRRMHTIDRKYRGRKGQWETQRAKASDERRRTMNSFKGQFLVAAQRQLDPNFAKTVILVCAHTERTAFGVVVSRSREGNDRPRERSATWCRPGKATLFRGGPVTGPLMAVHTRARFGEWQILPGVFFSRKENNVLALMRRSERLCRIFTGYVGWGPGQLDDEVQQGTWRVVPATPEQVFQADSDLWEQLSVLASRMQLRSMLRIRYFPLDPLLN